MKSSMQHRRRRECPSGPIQTFYAYNQVGVYPKSPSLFLSSRDGDGDGEEGRSTRRPIESEGTKRSRRSRGGADGRIALCPASRSRRRDAANGGKRPPPGPRLHRSPGRETSARGAWSLFRNRRTGLFEEARTAVTSPRLRTSFNISLAADGPARAEEVGGGIMGT